MSSRARGRFILGCFEVVSFTILSFFILLGTFDLARGLNQYVMLKRVVEAGATYASLMPGLERGSFLANVSTNPRNHTYLQNELFDVLEKLGFDVKKTTVSTQNLNDNSVRIEISAVFTPRFGLFRPIPIEVSYSGPYRKGKGLEV